MISTLTNPEFLALGQREQRGEVKIWSINVLPHNYGYRVDWLELPVPTPPRASQTPAQGVPEPKQVVVVPVMVACDDCDALHPIDEPCRICGTLARAMQNHRRRVRDWQLRKRFGPEPATAAKKTLDPEARWS